MGESVSNKTFKFAKFKFVLRVPPYIISRLHQLTTYIHVLRVPPYVISCLHQFTIALHYIKMIKIIILSRTVCDKKFKLIDKIFVIIIDTYL